MPISELLQILSPVVFLLCYFKYDIYWASLALSIVASLQLIYAYINKSSESNMNQSSLLLLIVFGVSTWYFKDPRFIQWKITIVNALFAIFIWGYALHTDEAFFTQTLKSAQLTIPSTIGRRADYLLIVFFTLTAVINYYVFTYFSEKTWVIFKTSIIFINLVYLLFITLYVSQYIQATEKSS